LLAVSKWGPTKTASYALFTTLGKEWLEEQWTARRSISEGLNRQVQESRMQEIEAIRAQEQAIRAREQKNAKHEADKLRKQLRAAEAREMAATKQASPEEAADGTKKGKKGKPKAAKPGAGGGEERKPELTGDGGQKKAKHKHIQDTPLPSLAPDARDDDDDAEKHGAEKDDTEAELLPCFVDLHLSCVQAGAWS
jgi:hypothetical protein